MQHRDTADLFRAISDLALDMYGKGETSPEEFRAAFHRMHGDLVEEFAEYGFDQFLRESARKAMGRVDREMARFEPSQTELFDGAEVPMTLPIVRTAEDGITRVWVSRRSGKIEDGDQYGKQLKANVLACQRRLIQWEKYWTSVRAVLEQNPDWSIGDAEDLLSREAVA